MAPPPLEHLFSIYHVTQQYLCRHVVVGKYDRLFSGCTGQERDVIRVSSRRTEKQINRLTDGETAAEKQGEQSEQGDMAATTATTGKEPDSKKKGKGPWMTRVENELEEAIELGVRSSTKSETRGFRVHFYAEQLARAKVQVAFYEAMLRLEEQKDEVAAKRMIAFEGDLQEQVERLQRLVVGEQAEQVGKMTTEEFGDDEDWRTVVPDSSGRVPVKGER